MADPVANVSSAVVQAAASINTTVEGAATSWISHVKRLWLKRMGWGIACVACLVAGYALRWWMAG